jgi:hypothetical protein
MRKTITYTPVNKYQRRNNHTSESARQHRKMDAINRIQYLYKENQNNRVRKV